jgi:uncharacterized protein (TIGR02300 family)
VAKTEWGLKRICPSCGTRYYDMKKNPPVCPSCGKAFDAESHLRTRKGRAAPKAVEQAAPEEVIADIPVADGDEAEDAVIEDAEELGEDGAVEEVIEDVEQEEA